MKQRTLTPNDKHQIESSVKAQLILEAQRDFMLDADESIKDQHRKMLENIISFYRNEYIPTVRKHASLMTAMNKLNIALISRGVYSKQEVIDFNAFLDEKLKGMFEDES
jgi:hypothetical protein